MKILLGGVHVGGEGYPNAQNTVSILRDRLKVEIVECGRWLGADDHLWKMTASGSRTRRVSLLLRIVFGNLASFVRVIRTVDRRHDIVYVPYPSLLFMWLVSLIPKRIRPKCIVDAYIPIWDAVVCDRERFSLDSLASKLLKRIETRAMRAAVAVLVDTEGNKALVEKTLQVPPSHVISLALAVREAPKELQTPDQLSSSRPLRILFVGTFVPLHGMEVLARAINAMKNDRSIHFRVIGDGQDADKFQSMLEEDVALDWYRGWSSAQQVDAEIAAADICLGVFGGSKKAARVLPLKLYHYLAHGKAVVTQKDFSLPANCPAPPVLVIDPADAGALPRVLSDLASSADTRRRMEREAREYYERFLSNDAVAETWKHLLATLE